MKNIKRKSIVVSALLSVMACVIFSSGFVESAFAESANMKNWPILRLPNQSGMSSRTVDLLKPGALKEYGFGRMADIDWL